MPVIAFDKLLPLFVKSLGASLKAHQSLEVWFRPRDMADSDVLKCESL